MVACYCTLAGTMACKTCPTCLAESAIHSIPRYDDAYGIEESKDGEYVRVDDLLDRIKYLTRYPIDDMINAD